MKAVDYRETLVTYLRSETTADAAKTLGISGQTLAARIKQMRKAGVKVPRKRTKGHSLSLVEVAQLNSLIIKHEKEVARF
jgi:biotin operon repressor